MTGGPGKDTFDCGHGPDLVTDDNPSEDTLIDCENALADTIGPTVTASPTGGTFATSQLVTLSSTAGDLDAIYYTTNGDTPSSSRTLYTGPIPISTTTTLKFIGYDTLGNAGPVGSETYTLTVRVQQLLLHQHLQHLGQQEYL